MSKFEFFPRIVIYTGDLYCNYGRSDREGAWGVIYTLCIIHSKPHQHDVDRANGGRISSF